MQLSSPHWEADIPVRARSENAKRLTPAVIRYILPALLALAVPAAALDLDRETEKRLFPNFSTAGQMRQVVKFEVIVSRCPEVKRGPNANQPWQSLMRTYSVTPPDVPGLRAYLRDEVARINADRREDASFMPISGWCDGARKLYGIGGIGGVADGIVNRDGTPARPKCYHDGSCLVSNYY